MLGKPIGIKGGFYGSESRLGSFGSKSTKWGVLSQQGAQQLRMRKSS